MKINAVYASTSGNTELVVESIGGFLKEAGVEVDLFRAEQSTKDVFESRMLIFATSTWEHGELNPFFKNLYEEMLNQDFSGKYGAFVGLGDTRYEKQLFCHGITLLYERFVERGGKLIGKQLKINGEPHTLLNNVVKSWCVDLIYDLEKLSNGESK
jgi:flavodoxin I